MKGLAVQASGVAFALAFSLSALPARAADAIGSGVSLVGSFLQMLASLAVVIGVILLFSHVANRWLKNVPAAGAPRYIRLVETRHLGPKKSLMLVEVGGDYFLLGNSPDGVQLIKQVDMLEEIEVVGDQESLWNQGAGGTLRNLFGKMSAGFLFAPMGRGIFSKNDPAPGAPSAERAAALFPPPGDARSGLHRSFAK